jgi:hypothetical protein
VLHAPRIPAYFSTVVHRTQELHLESHGPLGTLWVGLGLGCFYIALIWLNTLLGFMLTPLFTALPASWLLDKRQKRNGDREKREPRPMITR